MKVLFAGPSLAGPGIDLSGIELRPPAAHGDLSRAVLDGATAIGLVDGLFDAVAAVWHKEILHALGQGVRVLGAASMGALRAAECAPFGMEPVGAIAASYLDGSRDDDADVGLVHAPEELGHLPLTEPMVEVEPTLARLAALGIISADDRERLLAAARAVFFRHRTLQSFVPEDLQPAYETHRVRLKRADALLLVDRLKALPATRLPAPGLVVAEPPMWRQRLEVFHKLAGVTSA